MFTSELKPFDIHRRYVSIEYNTLNCGFRCVCVVDTPDFESMWSAFVYMWCQCDLFPVS